MRDLFSLASIGRSTLKNYEPALGRWWNFFRERQIPLYLPTVPQVIEFLQLEFFRELLLLITLLALVTGQMGEIKLSSSASTLMDYLDRTNLDRGPVRELFVSVNRGVCKAVCKETLSNWVKLGIDTVVFFAHSARLASNSAAKRLGVNMKTILRTAA